MGKVVVHSDKRKKTYVQKTDLSHALVLFSVR